MSANSVQQSLTWVDLADRLLIRNLPLAYFDSSYEDEEGRHNRMLDGLKRVFTAFFVENLQLSIVVVEPPWRKIKVGSMELVQQDEEGPSPFRQIYGPGEEGIHHMAMMVDDLDTTYAEVSTMGLCLAARAETLTGTEFAFVDTVDALGHMLEAYEKSDALLGFYDMVKKASLGWDGSDPVRTLG